MPDEQLAPKKGRGRPKKVYVTLPYEKLSHLASFDYTRAQLAAEVGMTEERFCDRLTWDTQLQAALDKSEEDLNYEYINFLAREHCTDEEIARKIGMSKTQFSVRQKKDPVLVDALIGGRNDFYLELRHSKKQAWKSQYSTICRECGYIMEGMEGFKEINEEGKEVVKARLPFKCKKCGSDALKYDKTPPSITSQIWESKQHLGETDKLTMQGDDEKPLVVKNMTDEQLDKKLKKLNALIAESEKAIKGKKEKEPSHEKAVSPAK